METAYSRASPFPVLPVFSAAALAYTRILIFRFYVLLLPYAFSIQIELLQPA